MLYVQRSDTKISMIVSFFLELNALLVPIKKKFASKMGLETVLCRTFSSLRDSEVCRLEDVIRMMKTIPSIFALVIDDDWYFPKWLRMVSQCECYFCYIVMSTNMSGEFGSNYFSTEKLLSTVNRVFWNQTRFSNGIISTCASDNRV